MKLAFALTVMAAPATAGQACLFDTECIERAACSDSAYELAVTEGDNGSWLLSDVSGDHKAGAVGQNWFAPLSDGDDGAILLSIGEDGSGRYSVHLPEQRFRFSIWGNVVKLTKRQSQPPLDGGRQPLYKC